MAGAVLGNSGLRAQSERVKASARGECSVLGSTALTGAAFVSPGQVHLQPWAREREESLGCFVSLPEN